MVAATCVELECRCLTCGDGRTDGGVTLMGELDSAVPPRNWTHYYVSGKRRKRGVTLAWWLWNQGRWRHEARGADC